MSYKHYIKPDGTYIGRHGSRPSGAIEISASLVGKAVSITNLGEGEYLVELDEIAEAIRLANVAAAAEEAAWEEMRAERNRRLTETDYTQLADSPYDSVKKEAYATYRQALRDLPDLIQDINNFEWPAKPE